MHETNLRIALIKPALSEHVLRGTGTYARELEKALKKQGVIVESVVANQLPENVDLYHFPYFDPFFTTLPWFRSKKTILTIHDLIPLRFQSEFPVGTKGKIIWMLQRTLAQQVSAVITDSESSLQDIEKYAQINQSKIAVIPLAASENFYKPLSKPILSQIRKQFSLPEKFGVFVGDVNWNKNLPRIIAAMKKSATPLVIVSQSFTNLPKLSYHPWEKSLHEAQQAAAGFSDVRILKNLTELELVNVYQLAHFLIYPSLYEGFGLPVVEAFAAGCPVITSNRGSLKEITDRAAISVDPENIAEMITAIKSLSQPRLRQQLIDRGRKQAQNFSWEKTAEATLTVYKKALHEK